MESVLKETKPYVLTGLGQQFVHNTMNEIVPRIAFGKTLSMFRLNRPIAVETPVTRAVESLGCFRTYVKNVRRPF
jgi:hypothetical protein